MPRQMLADATRVVAGDDRVRYDQPSIGLHWATAIVVVALWLLAQVWGFFPQESPVPPTLISLHVSLGLGLILVLAARIAWRIGPARRVLPADTGSVETAARGVHYLLYGLLVCVVIAGLFNRWLHGEPMTFFWLFTIPSPVAKSKALASTINEVHGWIANTILILAALHALAALFHHFVLRDDVLLRMLPGRQARRAEAATPPPPGAPKQS